MIRDATRWPEIAQGYRLAFDDAVAAQRERGYNLFRDGDDMFDWWVGGGRALGNALGPAQPAFVRFGNRKSLEKKEEKSHNMDK